jgi:hypothetical protein
VTYNPDGPTQVNPQGTPCAACNGSGFWKNNRRYKCFKCDGTGFIKPKEAPRVIAFHVPADDMVATLSRLATGLSENAIWPQIRTRNFIFSLVLTGKNQGAIYVKARENKLYLGKIQKSIFELSRDIKDWNDGWAKSLVEELTNPEASALEYGREFGVCSICGRMLTNPESIRLAIGPICGGRAGFKSVMEAVSVKPSAYEGFDE